ncbi:MAG: ribose-phosphate diphosphokinase [Spirochaetaceae bacterium]|jgi:ribose-phosphate pyrophosphokinase|nr:ribose-phosphate diphosphokinase [Spirochaetaceae bacterium]
MPYSEPTRLAVVACPGGEVFADEVIVHLKHMCKHRFGLKQDAISKRYKIGRDEFIRQANLLNDMQTSDLYVSNVVDSYRPPEFKVKAKFTYFMNGEFKTEILESIRGKDVYIFQDIENHAPLALNEGKNVQSLSVNDHLMTLMVTLDTVRQAGAAQITLVIPVYPYSRQHKKKGREGLTASLLGHIFESMGVARIITLDIHSREIINTFRKTHLENLHASYQILREMLNLIKPQKELDDLVVVAPDTGAVDRNKFYATALEKPLAMIYKERDYSLISQDGKDTNIKAIKLLGDVRGKVAFLADDMLATGGTLLKAMEFLKDQGAKKVICAVSLPLFTGDAVDLFNEAYKQGFFYRIIGTNVVYHENLKNCEWYINTNISGLFANVIVRVHHNQSLSKLLDNRTIIEKLLKTE